MTNRFGDCFYHFRLTQLDALVLRLEALRDRERYFAFVETRYVEADGKRFQFSFEMLRGERRDDRGINSAAEKAGHRNVGKQMLFDRRFKQSADSLRRGFVRRNEGSSTGPVA